MPFVFNSAVARTRNTNIDRIADFKVGVDTVELAKNVFKALPAKGVLSKSAFTVGTAAKDSSDRIIYNKTKGVLYYDVDGRGPAAAIPVATLDKYLNLTYKDFFIL